ncbi:hypothetical protein ABZ924_16765 [Streptomyces sp. NPDC046876]|uniref:hypothetical protein n=1 Tax=Streptomyces sp. NPDC046876 TaxID=3155616 RepID=UPI0033D756EB
MSKIKRAMGIVAATALAGALPVLAASPAQASYTDCTNYMENLGYVVGPNVRDACSNGENGFVGGIICQNILYSLSVKIDDANEACYQAARD